MKQFYPSRKNALSAFQRIILVILPTILWTAPILGQVKTAVKAVYDTANVPELFNTVDIGFVFTSPDGRTTLTRGLLGGRIHWNSLEVHTAQGSLQNGSLIFDRDKVAQNNHQVTFDIHYNNDTFQCSLFLPYVEEIRFNLYTDSLKRDNPFYLNVEGHFSNGRIYPMDTGMVAFRVSAGLLKGSTLLVTHQDTGTHHIQVKTVFKSDPKLRDEVDIPVKILPDTTELPSERQLLNKWQSRHHR